jgi:hypothetical protein
MSSSVLSSPMSIADDGAMNGSPSPRAGGPRGDGRPSGSEAQASGRLGGIVRAVRGRRAPARQRLVLLVDLGAGSKARHDPSNLVVCLSLSDRFERETISGSSGRSPTWQRGEPRHAGGNERVGSYPYGDTLVGVEAAAAVRSPPRVTPGGLDREGVAVGEGPVGQTDPRALAGVLGTVLVVPRVESRVVHSLGVFVERVVRLVRSSC